MSAVAQAAAKTARMLAVHRRMGFAKKPRGKIPPQVYPKQLSRAYEKQLVKVVDPFRGIFAQLVHELPGLIVESRADGFRADAGQIGRVHALIEQAESKMKTVVRPPDIMSMALSIGKRVTDHHKQEFVKQAKAAMGIDIFINDAGLTAKLHDFGVRNVGLISTLPKRSLMRVEKIATNAVSSGVRVETVAAEIAKGFKVDESDAKRIARDQVGKLYGAINRDRQTDLGISKFIWRTSEDEKVRPSHDDIDGDDFSWDDLPTIDDEDDQYPGLPIQCRCSAEPDFDDIMAQADALGDDSADDDAA